MGNKKAQRVNCSVTPNIGALRSRLGISDSPKKELIGTIPIYNLDRVLDPESEILIADSRMNNSSLNLFSVMFRGIDSFSSKEKLELAKGVGAGLYTSKNILMAQDIYKNIQEIISIEQSNKNYCGV